MAFPFDNLGQSLLPTQGTQFPNQLATQTLARQPNALPVQIQPVGQPQGLVPPGAQTPFPINLAANAQAPFIPEQNAFAPGGQPSIQSAIDPNTGAPITGLTGSEQALTSTANLGLGVLQGAVGGFGDITQQGGQAGNIQAALSGALGPEQQQAALAQLQPTNQFLQEQGERAITRNAAAIGGLGGGNVRKALTAFGQGLATQNQQQQFANLGAVSAQGFNALQNQAALQQNQAALLSGTGTNLAQGRLLTGQQIGQAAGQTAADIANLQSQLGAGLAGQFGQTATSQANLTSGTGLNSAQINQQIATLLANIGTQSGSQQAGFTSLAGQFDASGILGQNAAAQGALQDLFALIPASTGTGSTTQVPATSLIP